MEPSTSASESGYPMTASGIRIRDMPERLRPREALDRLGVQNVSDDVLVAIILRGGIRGANAADIARQLLQKYTSLTNLAQCSVKELTKAVPGMGPVKARELAAALEIARRLNEEAQPKRYRVRTPEDAARLLRDPARLHDKEMFWVLHLDAKNHLKGNPQRVTEGLLDSCQVHPREVFREAVRTGTARAVLVHNHPSGDPTPSAEDIRVTRQLIEAGRIMDIQVLDHVILGKAAQPGERDFLSMREGGVVEFG